MSLNGHVWLSLTQNAGTLMAESINTVKSREARFGIYEGSINMSKEKYFYHIICLLTTTRTGKLTDWIAVQRITDTVHIILAHNSTLV